MTSTRIVVYSRTIRENKVGYLYPTYYYMEGTLYYSSWHIIEERPDMDVAVAKLGLLEKIYGHKKDDLIIQAKRIGMLL